MPLLLMRTVTGGTHIPGQRIKSWEVRIQVACSYYLLGFGPVQHVLMLPYSWVKADLLERAQELHAV